MLKYSPELNNYVKSIIPLITLSDEYRIIGSYGKTKYITDIDITNFVKDINFEDKLNHIINKIPTNVKLFTLTSGFDKSFSVSWEIIDDTTIINYKYYESIEFINELFFNHKISEEERDFCNDKLSDKPIISSLILIDELLYQKSKIKWNINEIKKGNKIINNIPVDLNSSINENGYNIIHYIIELDDDFIPVDIALKNKKDDMKNNKFDKQNYLMFVKKEYYFILSSMKKYFHGKGRLNEIRYLLYDKYGWFIQIMMNIFYLIEFLKYPIYDNIEYKNIFNKVMDKIKINNLGDALDINKYIMNKDELIYLLTKLEKRITLTLNEKFKGYAYKYFNLLPDKKVIKYAYIALG